MKETAIAENLRRYITLNPEELRFFLDLLEEVTASRKEYLLREGQRAEYFYWVMEGCVMAYITDEGGDEHVMQFAGPFWWSTDLEGFTRQQGSTYTLRCMTDVEALALSRENFTLLLEKVPRFEKYFRIIFQNALMVHQQRIMEGISQTAMDRYATFHERYGSIEQMVPQKYVASYLGMSPEFLSKMKSKRRTD